MMAMATPADSTIFTRQSLTDLRWVGPNSDITVKNAKTHKRLRLLDHQGRLIRYFRGG